jgi:hypothetical protein
LPPRPASPTITYTAVLTGPSSLTIAAGTTYYGVNIDPEGGPYGIYYNAGWGSPVVYAQHEFFDDWTLINQGTIWTRSTLGPALGVHSDILDNAGTIVGEVGAYSGGGSARSLLAYGALIGGNINATILDNSGSIYAVAEAGSAFAVYTTSSKVHLFNSGLIAARATWGADHSSSGGAYGIRIQNDASFTNQAGGRVLAEGDQAAVAIEVGRGSHPAWDLGPEIVNRGLVQAVVTGSDEESIAIKAVNLPTELMRIVNSGTIKADLAIWAPSGAAETFSSSIQINPQTVTNEAGGLIEGDIRL